MRIVYQRCCGMDVHKNSITTCVLLIDDDGELRTEKRYFRTMTRDLKEMATWLASLEVEAIAVTRCLIWMTDQAKLRIKS
jgi:transposase